MWQAEFSLELIWLVCVFQDSVLSRVRPKKFVLQVLLAGLASKSISNSTASLGFVINCV
jgi:hypothetical protein